MALTKMQCENCGGFLQIDPDGKNAVCLSCGTPYIKKDDHFVINHITIVDEHSSHARLRAGDDNMRIQRYDYAMRDFSAACEIAPGDHRGWWGMIRASSHDFSRKDLTDSQFAALKDYYDKMMHFAPVDMRPKYYRQFTSYYEPLYKAHIEEKKRLTQTIGSLDSQINKTARDLQKLEEARFDLLEPFSVRFSEFLWSCIGIGIILLLIGYPTDNYALCSWGAILVAIPVILYLLYYVIIRPIPNMIIRICRNRNYRKRNAVRVRMNNLYQQKSEASNRLNRISY